ncbi:MBL fold metallo-hydrolase [Paenibacillus sp. YN15]|uniref:MBL fold metallo-hydrolase n=1 Tax=Paenibacillus sp. YN15 TaxID=1742774 RepID=UPI000DCE2126|nr:MBL fold metallo-hydrolase [Paenibacillus sp. YN15]RAV05693.1 metal-dependent hydrolase [Paenibacillus sp. YN15]
MKIIFYGHFCFTVEHDGVRLIIDPFLSGNPAAGLKPDQVQVDAVILTHGHDDHFGDALEIASRCGCPVIAIHELAHFCAGKGVAAHGMNLGGTCRTEGYSVKLTPALHSSSVSTGGQLLYAGELHRIDAAALPIGDNYTMGPEEAVLAAQWICPGVVIPAHYDTFPGIRQDRHAFAAACEAAGIRCAPLLPGESIEI